MADFSTSNVAATVGQNQQTNPIDTIQKFAFIQNLMNQNRLFQGQTQAGQAFQGAIDPATGFINQATLGTNLQGIDPRFAAAVPQATQEGATLATTNQALATKRYANIATVMGSVPKGSSSDDYMSALRMGVANNLYTGDDASNFIGGNVPSLQQWQRLATQAAVASGSAAEGEAQGGVISNLNTGGAITPVVQNRFAPQGPTTTPAAAAPIPMTQTPEAMGTPVSGINPATGAAFTVPRSAVETPTGQPLPNVPSLTGPQGQIATGLGPQAQATYAATGAGEAAQALAWQARAADVPMRKTNLTLLSNEADQFTAGPQSPFWKSLGAVASEYDPKFPGFGPIPSGNAVAAQSEFEKVAGMILGAQRSATGLGNTDYQAQLAGAITPNEKMTTQSIQKVIGTIQANEDLYNSQFQLWEKAKSDPRYAGLPFDQFQARFNQNVNPLVFQAQYADPADRAKIIQEVGPDKFKAQWKALYNQGLIGQ